VICSVRIQVPKEAGKTQFITGCKSEKKETFQIHAKSNSHLRAHTALLSQQKPVCETMLVQSFSKATKDLDERDQKEVAVKMTTAYFVAKEEPPFNKFNPLISLQKKNGLPLTSTYAKLNLMTRPVLKWYLLSGNSPKNTSLDSNCHSKSMLIYWYSFTVTFS